MIWATVGVCVAWALVCVYIVVDEWRGWRRDRAERAKNRRRAALFRRGRE